jgi:hypothetical protein
MKSIWRQIRVANDRNGHREALRFAVLRAKTPLIL